MGTTLFNFVIDCPDAALPELKNTGANDARVFNRGDLNWCLRAYLILLQRKRLPVCCSNQLLPGAINIIHSDQLLQIKGGPAHFLVCVRADFPPRPWAHYHIVQNKNQLGASTSYVPHWIQPGLISRHPQRKGVSRVAYAGQIFNGNMAGSEEHWKDLFAAHGIEFTTLSSAAWHDLSAVDVLIGIRSFDARPYDTKPPSKLFSAWHGGIPFIGGYDSAYEQVGCPGTDYLRVKTPDQAVAAVLQLRDDAALYERLVQLGRQKAQVYTDEHIAEVWEEVLGGAVLDRYQRWLAQPAYERRRFYARLGMAMLEHRPKQLVKHLLGKNSY